ncbi:MAG TPA: response regulator transcription factor [bacterium]
MPGARVLVVDDEPQIRRALSRTLEANGFDVRAVATGEDALASVGWHPDVVLLDLMLPDLDGLEVARRLREQVATPILVLSAREEERQKVAALDQGADDYITKPFGAEELLARIRVALRRTAGQGAEAVIDVGELHIDFERRLVIRGDEELHLTPSEYAVLKYMAQHAGRVITHRMLLQHIWGPERLDETQYLYVLVSQLRRKIEPEPARPAYILTEPGVGYRFRPPADTSPKT